MIEINLSLASSRLKSISSIGKCAYSLRRRSANSDLRDEGSVPSLEQRIIGCACSIAQVASSGIHSDLLAFVDTAISIVFTALQAGPINKECILWRVSDE